LATNATSNGLLRRDAFGWSGSAPPQYKEKAEERRLATVEAFLLAP